MSQKKRKKLTREEKAKRNETKGKRRAERSELKRKMEQVIETKRKAERLGIELPDSQDLRRYGRGG